MVALAPSVSSDFGNCVSSSWCVSNVGILSSCRCHVCTVSFAEIDACINIMARLSRCFGVSLLKEVNGRVRCCMCLKQDDTVLSVCHAQRLSIVQSGISVETCFVNQSNGLDLGAHEFEFENIDFLYSR